MRVHGSDSDSARVAIIQPSIDLTLGLTDRIRLMKKLYVGNLPFSASEAEIQEIFSQHGEVASVAMIMDRETGRQRSLPGRLICRLPRRPVDLNRF